MRTTVEVQRMGVAGVARERLDADELRDALVIELELTPTYRRMLFNLVELHKRDRRQHVG